MRQAAITGRSGSTGRVLAGLCLWATAALSACVMLCAAGSAMAAQAPVHELVAIQKKDAEPEAAKPGRSAKRFQTNLGKVIGEHLHRPVRFLDLPRNRMVAALENGDGDILCGYLPQWLAGDVDWSVGFIPVVELVASTLRVAAPATLADLKGKRIGTVLGFKYPELEAALGKDFVRDDALSEESSLRKILAGRFDYIATTKAVIDWHLLHDDLPVRLNTIVVHEFSTKCAVSRHGRVTLDEVNKAIEGVVKSGELARLLRER